MTLPLRLALWASLAGVMVLPLALVVSLALGANHLPELIDQGLLTATANSLVSSLLSAVGAVIIGTLMAFGLDRTDLPGRGALRLLLLTPLFIPPFIGAIAWSGLLTDGGDPLGVETFATHRLPLDEAPQAYETFQKKADGMFKVVLKP